MRAIEPEISLESNADGLEIMKHIEKAGRVCYKSEEKIADASAETS